MARKPPHGGCELTMGAKPNAKGRDTSEHFTKLIRNMMTTPAWRALSPKAQALYPWLKFEWHGPKANNNGRIRLSCRQASELMGVSVNTANGAFQELQAKGFIVVTEIGALGAEGYARGPSYEITELALPFAEKPVGRQLYRDWKPGTDFPVSRHAVNNPGGRNGRDIPSSKSRRTHHRIDDVSEQPVIETDTPYLNNCDVSEPLGADNIINFETSLVTRPRGIAQPPILRGHVGPELCEWRTARLVKA